MDRTASLQGYEQVLAEVISRSPTPAQTEHLYFSRGCALSVLGHDDVAKRGLSVAREKYSSDTREWARDCEVRAEALSALNRGTALELEGHKAKNLVFSSASGWAALGATDSPPPAALEAVVVDCRAFRAVKAAAGRAVDSHATG